jgi:hypothetical protein
MRARRAVWLTIATGAACALFCHNLPGQSRGSPADQRHWSFRPRATPRPPCFSDPANRRWLRTPVDAFILAKLKQHGLRPSLEADRRTLIRRLYFDLTGLPPAPEEIETFVADPRPDAYERLAERLLASPRYGEHWGQHWLDVVRYAETEGFEYDRHRIGAWRYRDYVVAAFNADKPYDRFVLEQVAGDEFHSTASARHPEGSEEPRTRQIEPPRRRQTLRSAQGGRGAQGDRGLGPTGAAAGQELLIAAGFHRLGPVRRNAGNQDVAFSRNEVLTDQTNAIGAVFLGLTIGCARCHDHKFDPILQTDFYRLQTFLAAAVDEDIPLAEPAVLAQWKAEYDEVNKEIEDLKAQLETALGEEKDQLEAQIKMVEVRLPAPLPSITTVRNDAARRTAIHLLDRGDPARPLQQVGMRAPEVLLRPGTPELPADTPRPRTELARWLTRADHPLTARVMVNRLWQWHFGQGIVATANDFGLNGDAPSHPELLDYLAHEFVRGGWRLKPLHRLIVLSSTYRQASVIPSGAKEDRLPKEAGLLPRGRGAEDLDPDNRLLWRFPRRRLRAEELRDAMLTVSGALNGQAGGPSVIVPVDAELVNLLYAPTQWTVTADHTQHFRRSIYLLSKRNLRLPLMEVFDQPDRQTSCARRESSTHAPQALELLNGRTTNQLAPLLAERLRRECGGDANRIVERAFLLATGRLPTAEQRRLATAFLKEEPLEEFALAVLNLSGLLYVD